MEKPNYELSETQIRFVRKAQRAGLEVDYGYSGRGMFGRYCPAVRLGKDQLGSFGFKGASSDSMGLGQVIYMER
jgi:hypothetical protein